MIKKALTVLGMMLIVIGLTACSDNGDTVMDLSINEEDTVAEEMSSSSESNVDTDPLEAARKKLFEEIGIDENASLEIVEEKLPDVLPTPPKLPDLDGVDDLE